MGFLVYLKSVDAPVKINAEKMYIEDEHISFLKMVSARSRHFQSLTCCTL